MRITNKILEAVHKGIQFALDDYQDDELNGSLSSISDVIDNEDVIKQKADLMKKFIDLDLPSGTLWAKYNIGANSEIEYGNYYAWGETEQKEKYDWSTYKYAWNGSSINLTKYVSNEKYLYYMSDLDNLKILQDEDDIAYLTYNNSHIHMPTFEQIEELTQFTTQIWIKNYKGIDKLNGCIFKSFQDPKKHLFIPASGYYGTNDLVAPINTGKICGIWSSSNFNNIRNDLATVLLITDSRSMRNEGEPAEIENRYRYRGYSVRAVYNK